MACTKVIHSEVDGDFDLCVYDVLMENKTVRKWTLTEDGVKGEIHNLKDINDSARFSWVEEILEEVKDVH